MSDEKVERRGMPWAFAVGVGLLALALLVTVLGGGTVTGGTLVLLAVGALLTCTGLIQRSIEDSRR